MCCICAASWSPIGPARIDRTYPHQHPPRAIQLRKTYFKARALTPSVEALLEPLFHGIALRELPTLLYTLTSAPPAQAVEGIRLLPIDRALLANTSLAEHEHISRRDSVDVAIRGALLRKGLWLGRRIEGQVVCWCTAEYLSADAAASALPPRGVRAPWDRHRDRRPVFAGGPSARPDAILGMQSRQYRLDRVAEKLGFVLLAQERYWAAMFQA